ncbi:MAG: neutral/alkaline non-lysosomal ceramidase N-terminal domain-containing protein [Anaerolineaceae bacterium]|nr:neutral/alkaline non-lysosomal ceramidase N-terminal domain-containing protein [Anaerolineaceae bacterium]
MIRILNITIIGVALLGLALTGKVSAAEVGSLQAGAAKIDVTPDANAIPSPKLFNSILDPLYVRAIYLENGHDRALLMNADNVVLNTFMCERVAKRISEKMNVPLTNILISATHDHSAMFGGPGWAGGDNAPNVKAYNAKLESSLFAVAEQAKANSKPARIGYGTGMLYLNVNRDAIDDQSRLWAQEPNIEYPSDKTLAVVKIESLSGEPIAVYMNYAMHAISLFLDGKISGDFPGEAERYLEHFYNDKAVVLWTSGAAGDQNPLYVRANSVIRKDAQWKTKMFSVGSTADNDEIDPVAMEESLELVKSEGQITAEEAIRIMSHIRVMNTNVAIEGAQDIVTCPGRRRLDNRREGGAGMYEDSPDPIRIKIGALKIGDIALGSANAELYSMIGQQVKQGSKFRDTIMVTLTNGMANSGYIPTDDAFGRYTFQVLSSALRPGCAEKKIVDGVDNMLERMN